MMMIVIMMIIASYTDDDDRHHDNDCMQARVLSCTPAAAAPIENRIILSVGAAAAVIFPGDILLMGAAVAGADKGTMGLGYIIGVLGALRALTSRLRPFANVQCPSRPSGAQAV